MVENTRVLKNYYKDYFKVGAACEHIHDRFTNNEIGNAEKEALLVKHFDSITFANELKPMYNMGFNSPAAREDYLPFVVSNGAKTMLDFVKANGLKMRGHVMVWHSQCPKEIFCKGYNPVTFPTDPEVLKEKPFLKHFEKLNPVCFVDRETMLKRLKSYIFSLTEYIYANNYADIIYAWDVVNEAIELEDKTETGLRNTYWYQVIGDDFMYYAFSYAREAVTKMSREYASNYGIDPNNSEALKAIIPALFYNDYNEFQPAKRDAIIAALKREGHGHGSILSEGLIDGIGMQGHLSDNNDIEEYKTALLMYSALVKEVHITELDVKCTCTNVNAEYYQAVFYKNFFKMLIDANKEGAHVTCATLWGLTDDNSWIRGADPLIFRGDLSTKKSFDGIIYAVTGEDLGEPEPITYNLKDRHIIFDGSDNPGDYGFKVRGFGEIALSDAAIDVRTGKYVLFTSRRFDPWTGIRYDISDFIGQKVRISTYVKSDAVAVTLGLDYKDTQLISVPTKDAGWVKLEGEFDIPANVHSMFINFNTEEVSRDVVSAVFVDEFNVTLIGQCESFEKETHIAAIRGMGHLPVLTVTDSEAHTESGHSLLVTRHEKDATVKFGISQYIGNKINVEAYVKTTDSEIRMGLDGAVPVCLATVPSIGEWTKVSFTTELPEGLQSQEVYIETNGSADMYIDDIFVCMA